MYRESRDSRPISWWLWLLHTWNHDGAFLCKQVAVSFWDPQVFTGWERIAVGLGELEQIKTLVKLPYL